MQPWKRERASGGGTGFFGLVVLLIVGAPLVLMALRSLGGG